MLVASPGSGEPPAAAAAWQASAHSPPVAPAVPRSMPPACWLACGSASRHPCPTVCGGSVSWWSTRSNASALPGAAALHRAAGSSELVCLPTAQVLRPGGEEVQAQRGAQQRPRRHDGHHRHDRPQRARRRLALPHRVLDARQSTETPNNRWPTLRPVKALAPSWPFDGVKLAAWWAGESY